jgi:hypothetical protein
MVRRKINNSMVGADSTAAAAGGMSSALLKLRERSILIDRITGREKKDSKLSHGWMLQQGGVIYFDRPEVLGGVYDRSVFFVVPPLSSTA